MRRVVKWGAWIVGILVLWAILDSEVRLLLALVALGGGWLAWVAGRELYRSRTRPRVRATPDELRPGQPFAVRFGPPPTAPEGLRGTRLRLVCRESRQRPVDGGRKVTDEHAWIVEEVDGDVRGSLELTVPVDAMHSFASRHHEIAWCVEAQGRLRGGDVTGVGVAPLTVLPGRYEA